MVEDFKRRFWVSLALTVPILVLSPMLPEMLGLEPLRIPGRDYVLFILATAVYVHGGRPFLSGLVSELQQRWPGMMTLIGVAISVAYFYSSAVVFGVPGEVFFWELATLIDIMLLGHWLEMRSIMGASRALEALAALMPSQAHLLEAGATRDVPVEQLRPGDRVLIKPGEKVPVDGRVERGETSIDEAMLTGESRPVDKRPGDQVIGGGINGQGAVEVVVEKTGADTYLAQVVELVRKARESRSRSQDVAGRVAGWLTLIALGGGVATFGTWLALGAAVAFSLERAVTVMIITCPHALGLAVPLVVAVSTSISATHGLLIRNRAAFEKARDLQVVVFDKTGTLTRGRFGVSDVIRLGHLAEVDVLRLAAAVEVASEHPIGRGIVEEAERRGLHPPAAEGFGAMVGRGVAALVEGVEIKVVSPGYLKEQGLPLERPEVERLAAQGKTVVYVLSDGVPVGAVALGDAIREESREAVAGLKGIGLKCLMLTGDNRLVAEWVAGELGLDGFFAEVLPQEKAARIEDLQRQGLTVAMVGDGINDAPALVRADVGIAIGAGTDVAVESADIVLVENDPRDVVAVVRLAKATYRKMVENLLWATGYNVVAIPLAAGVAYPVGVILSPAVGALLMSASTIVVAINAQRLRLRDWPAAPPPTNVP
ncbi:MAG: copper-translocating P-type ATPase [Pseudomonadota bacterium]